MNNKYSREVCIKTLVATEGYECTIEAQASWTDNGERLEAKAVRQVDLYKAQSVKGTTVEEFIEATKRDALRELVTQLNVYKVL